MYTQVPLFLLDLLNKLHTTKQSSLGGKKALTETFSQAALQPLYIQHCDDIEVFFPCSWLLCEISTFIFKTHTGDN